MGTHDVVTVETRGHVRLTPAELWPLIADTPRLNRAIGLPPMHFSAEPLPDGGSRTIVEFRLFDRLPYVRWTEHPFSWEAPRYYSVRRDFHWGPLASVDGGVELTPAGDGTDVRVFADFTPRHAAGGWLAQHVVGPQMNGRVLAQCREFERARERGETNPFAKLAPARGSVPVERVGTLAGRLVQEGADATLADRLQRHLLEAPDEDIVSIEPFVLADRWGAERDALLVLFLQATVAGLLVMNWEVMCPNCRVGKVAHKSLRDLQAEGHCDGCNMNFDTRFARLIQARFTAAPSIRRVSDRRFCSGGPLVTPHIVAQADMDPGSVGTLTVSLTTGQYLIQSAQAKQSLPLTVTDPEPVSEPRDVRVVFGRERVVPDELSMPAGTMRLHIANETGREIAAVVERREWPDTTVTAAHLATLAAFRDLFSAEVLAAGMEVAVERVALLFTDLTGSTALYQQVGQARAFRLVQEHFAILDGVIRDHGGALVKTIGDAIMAAFPSGAQALGAAVAMQRAIRSLDTGGVADPAKLVKIGIHEGSCLAVTLNERLDYFGTTVNVAARLNHESRGGEIVVSADVLAVPDAAGQVSNLAALEETEVNLRGVREPVRIARFAPGLLPAGV